MNFDFSIQSKIINVFNYNLDNVQLNLLEIIISLICIINFTLVVPPATVPFFKSWSHS
jgi:hypothetical protein